MKHQRLLINSLMIIWYPGNAVLQEAKQYLVYFDLTPYLPENNQNLQS